MGLQYLWDVSDMYRREYEGITFIWELGFVKGNLFIYLFNNIYTGSKYQLQKLFFLQGKYSTYFLLIFFYMNVINITKR